MKYKVPNREQKVWSDFQNFWNKVFPIYFSSSVFFAFALTLTLHGFTVHDHFSTVSHRETVINGEMLTVTQRKREKKRWTNSILIKMRYIKCKSLFRMIKKIILHYASNSMRVNRVVKKISHSYAKIQKFEFFKSYAKNIFVISAWRWVRICCWLSWQTVKNLFARMMSNYTGLKTA